MLDEKESRVRNYLSCRLLEKLQQLAMTDEEQRKIDTPEELMEEFDQTLSCIKTWHSSALSSEQWQGLAILDTMFDSILTLPHFVDDDATFKSPEWAQMREFARELLKKYKWQLGEDDELDFARNRREPS